MDQILEEKIEAILSKKLDQQMLSKQEVTEIVNELKPEMEVIVSKTVKSHLRALAQHVLDNMED